jgi:5'-nucleotidase
MGNRREFIKDSLLTGAGFLLLPGLVQARHRNKKTRITILHTNDFHSHIDPFPDSHPVYPGMGGSANLKSLINQHSKEDSNYLLLDCGDIFQGTPYFNLFGGVPELEWMSHAGYHATTLGNHDFDNGIEKLAEVLKHANFPVLNCNYTFTGTVLEGKIQTHKVFEVAGKRIGVTGVGINPEGLILPNLIGGVVYNDPVAAVQKTVDNLRKKEKCHMVIVLSHLGYSYDSEKIDDRKLAAATNGIDVILGGHTHTFLEAPVQLRNKKGEPVVINQAGWAGLRLGKVVMDV